MVIFGGDDRNREQALASLILVLNSQTCWNVLAGIVMLGIILLAIAGVAFLQGLG